METPQRTSSAALGLSAHPAPRPSWARPASPGSAPFMRPASSLTKPPPSLLPALVGLLFSPFQPSLPSSASQKVHVPLGKDSPLEGRRDWQGGPLLGYPPGALCLRKGRRLTAPWASHRCSRCGVHPCAHSVPPGVCPTGPGNARDASTRTPDLAGAVLKMTSDIISRPLVYITDLGIKMI